jgi:hypothetical protein
MVADTIHSSWVISLQASLLLQVHAAPQCSNSRNMALMYFYTTQPPTCSTAFVYEGEGPREKTIQLHTRVIVAGMRQVGEGVWV